MARLLSNTAGDGFVRSTFTKLAEASKHLQLAAPYFTYADPVKAALFKGASVDLLVGLNSATRPDSLREVMSPRCRIRFYTGQFHAKLYVFDAAALVGSANLTQAGFQSNREVVACFSTSEDEQSVLDARAIFDGLWEHAQTLSAGTLKKFEDTWLDTRKKGADPDALIAEAVGKVEPPSISVDRHRQSQRRAALERLRRQLDEYHRAFDEVTSILTAESLLRDDVRGIAPPFRTNRFLNWLRLTHIPKDDWRTAPLREPAGRRAQVQRYAEEWRAAKDGKVFEGYAEGIQGVLAPFADPEVVQQCTKEQISAGLRGVHAFTEQLRWQSGGELLENFWSENGNDVAKVRGTLQRLLHGEGDFVERLADVTTNPDRKLKLFGKFCGLELAGTVKPADCPPVNGRSAKGLRFLGYEVDAD